VKRSHDRSIINGAAGDSKDASLLFVSVDNGTESVAELTFRRKK
jgi:hypothetical protein